MIPEREIETIAKEFYPKVKGWVAFQLQQYPSEQEDLVQEIMSTVVTCFRDGKFNYKSQKSTYIFSITKNKVSDFLRFKKVRKSTQSLDKQVEVSKNKELNIPARENLEAIFETKEKLAFVRRIIRNMNKNEQEILQLFYFEHLTFEEIAEKLSIPIKEVYNRRAYCWKKLMNLCEAAPDFSEFLEVILLIMGSGMRYFSNMQLV